MGSSRESNHRRARVTARKKSSPEQRDLLVAVLDAAADGVQLVGRCGYRPLGVREAAVAPSSQ
jgi:hypothetical protein